MSMAELIKSFHFYYLSHDCGLDYVFPVQDYEKAVLRPWLEHLESRGAEVRLSSPVHRIDRVEGGFEVDGEWVDEVVIASDIPGCKSIVSASPTLVERDPLLESQVGAMKPGQRYAVLRVWLDVDVREGLPMFTVTDRVDMLDSVTTYHRYETASMAWVEARGGGSVLELHCYAVPDNAVEEHEVRDRLVSDMRTFFPEIKDARVIRAVFQVKA
ncbi:MAG: FAD-dependent oxidoreductase, partial [Myxococcota bacterium]